MRLILFLILLVLCLFSCKKEETVSPGLFGKWELRRMTGGLAGADSSYKAGNGNIFVFNSDSTYSRYLNGKFYNNGTFSIPKDNNPTDNSAPVIYLDHNTSGLELNIKGTELTLGSDYADGMVSTYTKIHN